MEAISLCPICHQPLTKVGTFQICPVHGQVALEPRPHASKRIFLSYGHDHNEELVRLIKTDLEKRGHDVWFDKNEIKFGDEWRRSITDGILGSNRVLSFLSKHSTRDPGVCRDEIAIAIGVKGGNIQTILVEAEQEVQPPVNIGHIQWLDMHEWQEKKIADGAAWEQWYQTKLTEIVRVVESDESRRFAGEIDKLNDYLKPIKSDARISGLLSKGFYGREWLFDAVENWRRGEGISRLFWIMGDPGVGKSAFAAQLTHIRGDTVIAAQFCEWDKPDHRDARRVVSSIAFQLATRLPDYRKLLLTLPEIIELDRKDASEFFDYLLANPLKSVINGGRERHLIIIDALDEAGESGRNPLVEMLARNAHHLPEWLGIVVTSRPEFDVKTTFQALNPLPLDTKSESNRADIRDYLLSKLVSQLQNRLDAEKLIEQILEKSEGVFLYVERFCDDIQQKHISLDHPDQFPQGLGGIFTQYFQRQFPDLDKFRKEVRPVLRAILAAREPLPIEILHKLFNWEDEELRDFIHTLGSLFPVTKTTDSETIKPYHKSLADWLGDETKAGMYFVSVLEGHRMLADLGNHQIGQSIQKLSNYFRLHLPSHYMALEQWESLLTLLSCEEFVKLPEMGQPGRRYSLILDYQNALKYSPIFLQNILWEAPFSCISLCLSAIGNLIDHGEYQEAKALLKQSEVKILTSEHPKLLNSWNCLSGRLAIYEGDKKEADLRLSQALNIARESGYVEGIAKALLGIGVSIHKLGGSFSDAKDVLEEALNTDFSSFDIEIQSRILLNLAMVNICKGLAPEAEDCLNRVDNLIVMKDVYILRPWLLKYRGYLCLLNHEFIEASNQFSLASESFFNQGHIQEELRCKELLHCAIGRTITINALEKTINFSSYRNIKLQLKIGQLIRAINYSKLIPNDSDAQETATNTRRLLKLINQLEKRHNPFPQACISFGDIDPE